MVWAKVDDKYPDHPKVIAAGQDAAWINLKAICWSNGFLTDGFVPEATAAHLTAHLSKPVARQVIGRLTKDFHGRAGLWEKVEGGYLIHDFLEYNPSKEAVEAERKASRQRQERFRENKSGRFGNAVTNDEQTRDKRRDTAVTNALVTPTPSQPSPAQPVPLSLSPTPSPPDSAPGAPDEKGGNGTGTPGRRTDPAEIDGARRRIHAQVQADDRYPTRGAKDARFNFLLARFIYRREDEPEDAAP